MTRRAIITVIGREGSGKTHLTRELMRAWEPPVFIIDTQDEFSDGVQFQSTLELSGYLVDRRPNRSGIYVVNTTDDEDAALFFRLVNTLRNRSLVVVDEASLFCSPNRIDPNLNELIQYGRHWKQSIIFNARRPAEVSRHITAQSAAIISFRQTEPRDVDQLKKAYSAAENLYDLDDQEFLVFGDVARLPDPARHVLEEMTTAAGAPAWQRAQDAE